MTDVQLWEKRDDESGRAFAAFAAYRDYGTYRSLDKVYVEMASRNPRRGGKASPKSAPRQWTLWSSLYEWVKRAEAYDQHLDEQTRKSYEEQLIAARQKLLEDELRDYAAQMDKWLERWQAAAGLELSLDGYFTLTKWRKTISDFGRRALSMPDTLADITSGGQPIAAPVIKFVWDDGTKDNGGHGDGDD